MRIGYSSAFHIDLGSGQSRGNVIAGPPSLVGPRDTFVRVDPPSIKGGPFARIIQSRHQDDHFIVTFDGRPVLG